MCIQQSHRTRSANLHRFGIIAVKSLQSINPMVSFPVHLLHICCLWVWDSFSHVLKAIFRYSLNVWSNVVNLKQTNIPVKSEPRILGQLCIIFFSVLHNTQLQLEIAY